MPNAADAPTRRSSPATVRLRCCSGRHTRPQLVAAWCCSARRALLQMWLLARHSSSSQSYAWLASELGLRFLHVTCFLLLIAPLHCLLALEANLFLEPWRRRSGCSEGLFGSWAMAVAPGGGAGWSWGQGENEHGGATEGAMDLEGGTTTAHWEVGASTSVMMQGNDYEELDHSWAPRAAAACCRWPLRRDGALDQLQAAGGLASEIGRAHV